MKILLVVVVVVAVALAVMAFARKWRGAAEAKARISDIPAVFERLRAAGRDGSFAVFVFTPPAMSSADEAINVQFSIEGGRIGFDWVLLGPPNIRDRDRFVQLASRLGYKVVDREMNQVKYLRVEDGGSLPRLCEASIRDLYSVPKEADLVLIPEGFAWP